MRMRLRVALLSVLAITILLNACSDRSAPTVVPTDARTPISMATLTHTATAAPTPTAIPTATATPTASPIHTATATPTPTAIPTATATPTASPTPTSTPSPTPTAVPTVTATPTASPTPTSTPSPTPTPRPVVLDVSPKSPTQMLVTWRLTVDDATSISLYRDGELAVEAASDALSYVDAGLDPNTRYEYRLEVGRRDHPAALDHSAAATLAYPPRFTEQRSTRWTGFQVPIVDELNPGHTEYRVTVSGEGSNPVISDWRSGKCRTFDGLRPHTAYYVSIAARNLDGIEASATEFAGGDEVPALVYHTRSRHSYRWNDDSWVNARVGDINRIYGLTEAAAEWVNNGIRIEWRRAQPGLFGYYPGGYIRVGHTDLESIMHEVMHAFWPHWNGFPEPCDQMNIYTFRSDAAQFVLDFREHDRSETPNPWEPWRLYYDWMVRLLENETPDEENYWDILGRQDFHRLKGFVHLMEASLPAHAAGKMDLIPPPLQKYMRGFLEEGKSTTWVEEAEWYSKLTEEGRRLWQVITGEVNEWTPLDLHVQAPVPDARIDKSLREMLKAAERQRLLDFINTLDDVASSKYWDIDPHFWDHYIEDRISLVPLYLNELDSSAGIELDETTFDAVVESLQSIWRLDSGTEDWFDVHGSVSSIEGLSEAQRTALLWMIESKRPELLVSISSGGTHTCGLRPDGTFVCWGRNSRGQSSPPESELFTSISSGQAHTCGLRPDGTAVCWGLNDRGQSSPPEGEVFTSISSGWFHTCGLRQGETAVCWGGNGSGQSSPPEGEVFTYISSGGFHTCGLRPDGTAVCWGDNSWGQSSPPEGEVFTHISSGWLHTCGLREDETAVCWGGNGSGQASPPGDERFIAITSGGLHACALRNTGTTVCWGDNSWGQSSPPEGEVFTYIDSGDDNTCGLRQVSTVVCWGSDDGG